MKGILLAAGKGSHLYPATFPVAKPLLPVFDKPMIYYPLSTLMRADIRDILMIVSNPHPFEELFGDGSALGMHISYKVQKNPKGIVDAFLLGRDFTGGDDVCLALGDNVVFGSTLRRKLRGIVKNFHDSAYVFATHVSDVRSFGVVDFDAFGNPIYITEKPTHPKSHYVIPGLYFYPSDVFDKMEEGLNITDINLRYLEEKRLTVEVLGEDYTWFDTGNPDDLYEAAGCIRKAQRSGKLIGCPEEQAWKNRWIDKEQLKKLADKVKDTNYGQYLYGLLDE